jgi:hypothetical protein
MLLASWIAPSAGGTDGGTWATWTKEPHLIFDGQFVASDPAIIRDGDRYCMFYTCLTLDLTQAFDPATTHAAISEAISGDAQEEWLG